MIIGEVENLSLIQAYVNENVSVEDELKPIIEAIGNDDELIIFTDLLGGSVNNQMMTHALKPNIHVVTGFNLPLLIEILMADKDTPAVEIIENAVTNAKEQLVYVNKLLTVSNPNND